MSASKPDLQKTLIDVKNLIDTAKPLLEKVTTLEENEELRVQFLGRKSELTEILRTLKDFSDEDRRVIGSEANKIKTQLAEMVDKNSERLLKIKHSKISDKEKIDITLPVNNPRIGHIHPVTQMLWRSEDIFQRMGFDVVYPYEVDDDYHNFTAVNLPEGHPARDNWDTFWTEDGHIAITHTSSMQNRIFKEFELPIRVIVPGRCFRHEATDARHEHTFTQIEGVYVDKNVTVNNMLATLKTFFSEFYGKEVEVKFTPDFFPFVEPGGMMSLTCILCDGKGCNVCKKTGWLEILGCGMIHPNVLKMGGIDSDTYSGFAWGFGLERLVMLKYNIEDIRHFYSGKFDFLKQF